MLKQNQTIKSFRLSEGKTQIQSLGLILIAALFFIGLVWLVGVKVNNDIDKANQNTTGTNQKNNEPKLPDSLKIPLYNKSKIEKVSSDENNGIEIIFSSSSSSAGIKEFYQDWSKDHGYVLADTLGVVEEEGKIKFSLVPGLGNSNFLSYNFIAESKEDKTEITINYFNETRKQPNHEQLKTEIKIDKDFQFK